MSTSRVGAAAGALLLSISGAARADVAWIARDVAPIDPAVLPDVAHARVDAGWSGASGHPTGGARAEVVLGARVSVFASAIVGASDSQARPGAGVAYQLFDPRASAIGVRLQVEYKAEGFVEPEGEMEAAIAVSRRIGDGLATVSAIAGQDPDARERDAELAGSIYEPVAPRLALGIAVRGRRALGTPGPGEPRADALAAPFAALSLGRTTLLATAGLDAIDRGAAGRAAGALGQLGLTVDW
jgi:hypothetical protein